MILIPPFLSIGENEIHLDFIRASGPGGQNVNKVASSVQLRFDVLHSPSLESNVKKRLVKLAGARMTDDGILIINAKRYRTQEQNRMDAIQRLGDLIRTALIEPTPRRATRPGKAAKARRLDSKKRRSLVKNLRQSKPTQHD